MYYVGENVQMICSYQSGNPILWTVNERDHNEFDTITVTNLQTVAIFKWASITEAYNNSAIKCGIQTEASFIWSNVVVIRLQGK